MSPATKNQGTDALPWILLGLLIAASGALLLSLTAGISFIADEWNLLFLRPGWGPDSFLEPFHEHIIIAPAFIYKLLQTIFGMESNRPFQLAAILTFLAIAPVLFVWMKRRIGPWASLIGVAIILFLGAAFEDLLWAFQIGYFGSLALGVATFLALDRDDRRGDVLAAILLVLSLAFSSVGLAFLAGATIEWLTNPRERRRRWLVPATGIIFFGLWWLGWGREAESAVSLSNLPELPRFVFDSAAAGITSILGLATGDGSEPDQPNLIWGRIGLVMLLGLSAWRLVRIGRIPAGVLITGGIALAFFALAALGQNELRLPTSSRYQLPGALFLLLFFTEVLRGIELKPPALAAVATVVLITSLSGVDLMREQAEERWRPASDSTRVYLGAVAFAGDAARGDLVIALGPGSEIPLDRFLEEIESSGSPGYSSTEIGTGEAALRSRADQNLIEVTGPALAGSPAHDRFGRCERHPAGSAVTLPNDRSEFEVRNLNPNRDLGLSLSRFGDPPGLPLSSVIAGSKAWLQLPEISREPGWTLTGDGTLALCRSD